MKKILTLLLAVLLSVLTLCFASCGEKITQSNKEYWFSDYSTNFVAYTEETDNIDEAGTYWNFTSKKDFGEITINIVSDSLSAFSTSYLYVNDVQIQSETNTGVYTFVYKLNLKKGDKIKIHAFWTNSLKTNESGFNISMFAIDDGTGTYVVKLD